MPVSIGPRIKVDGEEKYRQQINQIIQQAKTLDAEMGALTASFDKDTTAQERARKSSELLNKQLEAAREQTRLVREMTEKATETKDADDRATLKWREALANAEAEQAKLERAVQENTAAIEGQTDAEEESTGKMVSLGDAVDQVAGKLGINLPDGAKKALNGMEGLSAGSVAAMGAVAAAVAAVVKVASELNQLTLEAANRADDLLTRATISGLTAKELQAFEYASPYIDVDASTIEAVYTRIPKVLSQAQEQLQSYKEAQLAAAEAGKEFTGELGAQASAFGTLGISLTDEEGHLRDYHEVVWEALEALGKMGDTTEAATLANSIFGKSYAELKPLMQNAAEAQRLMNEAEREGYLLSDEQLQILAEVDDANQKLIQTKEKYANLIATQWAPVNKQAYETLATLMDTAGKSLLDSHLIENTAELISNTLKLAEGASKLIAKIPTWLNPLDNLNRKFELINKTINGTLNLLGLQKNELKGYDGLGSDIAGAEWKDDVQAWVSRGGSIIGEWNYADFDKATGELKRSFDLQPKQEVVRWVHMDEDEIRRLMGYNAAGTSDWRGGLTWVGEAGPELVRLPQHAQILSNQESRALAAGDQHIVINVQGIEQLDQVVRWYTSMQTRERMR